MQTKALHKMERLLDDSCAYSIMKSSHRYYYFVNGHINCRGNTCSIRTDKMPALTKSVYVLPLPSDGFYFGIENQSVFVSSGGSVQKRSINFDKILMRDLGLVICMDTTFEKIERPTSRLLIGMDKTTRSQSTSVSSDDDKSSRSANTVTA